MANGTYKLLKDNGTSWDEKDITVTTDTIIYFDSSLNPQIATLADFANYARQGAEFKGDLTITSNAIDWASGFYKEITLSANTTYTFTNLEKGKVIHLKMTGAYVPTFPSGCIIINGGTYTGAKQNNIYIECVNSSTPQFKIAIQTEP